MQELINKYSDYQLAEFYMDSFFESPHRLPKEQEEILINTFKLYLVDYYKEVNLIDYKLHLLQSEEKIKLLHKEVNSRVKKDDKKWVLKDIINTLNAPQFPLPGLHSLQYHFGIITGRFSFIEENYAC
jgi:hypothetical protein